MKEIEDNQFESEVLQNSKLTIVDFWATWCGPCRALMPTLEEVSTEMSDKVEIIKMNVDKCAETPMKFNVRSIPTLIMFKDGKEVETAVGPKSKDELIAWINENI